MKLLQYILHVLLCYFLLTGCATIENQGQLVRSGEVTQLVESATVLSNHTYYYTGPQVEPDAIIAINNQYALQAKYWIKVDDVAAQLEDWNRYIDNDHRVPFEKEGPWNISPFYTGAKIMTPDGKQAGIWYSRLDYTVIHFPEPSTIVVYAPFIPVGTEPVSQGY